MGEPKDRTLVAWLLLVLLSLAKNKPKKKLNVLAGSLYSPTILIISTTKTLDVLTHILSIYKHQQKGVQLVSEKVQHPNWKLSLTPHTYHCYNRSLDVLTQILSIDKHQQKGVQPI
jgi:hypothetical protein